eukprot:scpid65277/ scgid13679/ 
MINDTRLDPDKTSDEMKYLRGQEIGVIISQGLAETYRSQPKNPVDFLGKWLLHHTEVLDTKEGDDFRNKIIDDNIGYFERKLKMEAMEQKELQDVQDEKDKKEKEYIKLIDESDDHEDNLQDLVGYLSEYTNSTSAYVGKLVEQKFEIEEDDDDTAHQNSEAPKIVDIYHSSPEDFKFVQRKTIAPTEGVTHDVFKEIEEPPAPEVPEVPEVPEGGEPKPEGEGEPEPVKEPEEVLPYHITVDEIVREPRIKYFKVPRLGSLLSVRMSYESCLFEQALDEAVNDVRE